MFGLFSVLHCLCQVSQNKFGMFKLRDITFLLCVCVGVFVAIVRRQAYSNERSSGVRNNWVYNSSTYHFFLAWIVCCSEWGWLMGGVCLLS